MKLFIEFNTLLINFQKIKMKNEHFYLFLGIDFNNVLLVMGQFL